MTKLGEAELPSLPNKAMGLTPTGTELPLSRPWLDEREEELVLEVLRSGRLSLGPWIEKFEEQIAERVGAPYAAAVSSGTAGVPLMCRIAGVGARGEGVNPPPSVVGSPECFVGGGGTPAVAA